MRDSRANPGGGGVGGGLGSDLHLDLDPGAGRGVRAALMEALRTAVRTGRLAPGTRLPPSRSLAVDLGVARNTVAEAYAELVAEGWLTARQGAGTYAAARTAPAAGARSVRTAGGPGGRGGAETRREAWDAGAAGTTRAAGGVGPAGAPGPAPAGWSWRPAHNLWPGAPDVSSFPRGPWLAAARRAISTAPADAFGYSSAQGRPELRRALADYLARARGVHAHPDRIVVCAGFAHGLALLGAALHGRGVRHAAVESYGLDVHWDLLVRAGLRLSPLPVDGRGARTGELAALPDVGAVLLTAAHQFPTGVPLHPDRRAAVADWARTTGGVVLEDDYDGEFRYDRQPVGALQGLDPEHVVYLGTASKSLAPGIRLGWMVVPERLVAEVRAVKETAEGRTGVLDQLTLAEFITSGAYDRHVRAMRQRYRRRRDQLVSALSERAPRIRVTGIAAGLHAVLELPPGTERPVVSGAVWHSLGIEGLSRYRHPAAVGEERRDALVIGYGTPPDHSFAGALEALCAALP